VEKIHKHRHSQKTGEPNFLFFKMAMAGPWLCSGSLCFLQFELLVLHRVATSAVVLRCRDAITMEDDDCDGVGYILDNLIWDIRGYSCLMGFNHRKLVV
jgi:hypothetical protein